jgi:hypothetical protein
MLELFCLVRCDDDRFLRLEYKIDVILYQSANAKQTDKISHSNQNNKGFQQ